ncbi:hypothetical protein [Flavobacterium sp. MK4S-17]|uniref:hypothetical protein n=1 Tax=Flavobacterium sp. MK4S-17 TaxID=2543737 RepID=UPI00135CAA43|nr:hypothetical protein [Flavobacterium sp. MK4S-17]
MNEVKEKIDQIRLVWNNYILEYKSCRKHINFTEDIQTNYIGIIFGYFDDTLEIICDRKPNIKSFYQKFSHHISLLQTIYIHQDFIEEMLYIFKCNVTKGDLKKDENYFINREIRNELIGHPIRKSKIGNRLISASLFGYQQKQSQISYLRYHIDNEHNFDLRTIDIALLIDRHINFLNLYLDKILQKLSKVIKDYIKVLDGLNKSIKKQSFDTIIKILSITFESFLEHKNLYNASDILKIYKLKDVHPRYSNYINEFFFELESSIYEAKLNASNFIAWKYIPQNKSNHRAQNLKVSFCDYIKFVDNNDDDNEKVKPKDNINHNNYALGKLYSKRDYASFELFSSIIKSSTSNNNLIIEEFDHMRINYFNDIEYYCSLSLIEKELDV